MHFISRPLDQFAVTPLAYLVFPIFSAYLFFTNLRFYALLTVGVILAFHYSAQVDKLVPSHWSVASESSHETLHMMIKEQLGKSHEWMLPAAYRLFWFILVSNLISNVPYGFRIATSAIVSLGLSLAIFIGVTSLSLRIYGVHFFRYFVPAGTPIALVPMLVLIELISYLARAVSLGVRLFRNIVAGHTLLTILSGFLYAGLTTSILVFIVTLLPLPIFIALIGLELAVSIIQAYVFTILTVIYTRDAVYLH